MRLSTFGEYAERMADTNSRIEKQDIVWEALQEADSLDTKKAILAFTTNQRFEDMGVAKKTVRNAAVSAVDAGSSMLSNYESDMGDLPSAVHKAAQRTERITPKTDISLSDLYSKLKIIESKSGKEVERAITKLLSENKPEKWLTHALLADDGVSLGFGTSSAAKMIRRNHDSISKGEMAKAKALCPDIIELYQRAPDVPTTPVVGTAFKPMLSDDKELPENPNGDWTIQPKFDGARVLIHLEDGEIRAFSRNLNEVTESLPELQDLKDELPDEGDYIFDGEAVAYKDDEPQDFKYIMTRFNREKNIGEQDVEVRFKLFDIIYHDERGDLSDNSTESRYVILDKTLPTITETITHTIRVSDAEEMMEKYNIFVEDGYEGAIVKELDAPYEYDKYSQSWLKIKDMKDNADLIIEDVIEGEDSRAGKMGSLRLRTSDGMVVGKVGTGFTEEDEEWFWNNRAELVGSVVEVEWQQLQQDENGDWGIRFPVFVATRDKPADEADTISWLKKQ